MQRLNELLAGLPEVSWSDGKRWFDQGLMLFRKHQLPWYGLALVMVFVILLSNISALLGVLVMAFVSPLLTAFWFAFLTKALGQQNVRLADAWSVVRRYLTPLMMLGVVLIGLTLLTQLISGQLMAFFQFQPLTAETVQAISGGEIVQRTLLNVVVNLPLLLVMTFSPPLLLGVVAHVWAAMQLSAVAVLKAWKGFVVVILMMFLMLFGVLILASLVFSVLLAVLGAAGQGLANGLVLMLIMLMMGVGMTVQFVAYRELFSPQEPDDEHQDESYVEL